MRLIAVSLFRQIIRRKYSCFISNFPSPPVLRQLLSKEDYVAGIALFRDFDDIAFLKAEITALFALERELGDVLICAQGVFSCEDGFRGSRTGRFFGVSRGHGVRSVLSRRVRVV